MVLQKRSIVSAAKRAAPALCLPAGAVRVAAARFFRAAAAHRGPADTYALLLPAARPFLRDGFAALGAAAAELIADDRALLRAVRSPPSRAAFDDAVVAAGGARRGRERSDADESSAVDVAATVDVAADGHGGRFHSGHFHDSGRHGASSFVVPRPARASGSPRRALDRKRREKSNPALAAAAAAAAAVSTTAVSRDAATVDAEAEKIAAEAAAEERATLEVMDGYVTSLAGARRGSRGDADGSGSRSLVAGGLTPEAVAAIRAAEAAAAAAAANATAQPRGLFAGRGGFGAGFGGVGFGGVGNGPDADGDANGNGGDAKSTSARNRREGSLNPLEGVLSPLARGSYGDVSTPTPVKPPARFHPGDGDGDDFGSDAEDAWSSAFGPRRQNSSRRGFLSCPSPPSRTASAVRPEAARGVAAARSTAARRCRRAARRAGPRPPRRRRA